ncbi:MAG TPA: DNA adenine methylase [Bryobacteraceae bacterium]|nr:DNA adenine methylase [Bryobacteraceae bacterium]
MAEVTELKAPFPWFGGKSRVAHLVWDRFGDVRNYVEPFAGSLATLLRRPTAPKIETVNDLDCWIANFWRALQADPGKLARWADWPVDEADLHARHLWLVNQADFRERMKMDPDFYDVKIAGWWVWGISQWIGSGWCLTPERTGRTNAGRAPRGINAEGAQKRPYLSNHGGGMGVHGGRKRPRLGNDHGRGVLRVTNQIPDLSGDAGAAGRAIHASGLEDKGGIYEWFYALADRLRRVRVCCGDWMRVLGPAPTTCIGTTGVFLDPPYAVDERSDVYNEESRDVAHKVQEWALANGDNPELRIALCGYEGEHEMPKSWSVVAWKANGGFANQKRNGTQGQQNAHRERIWFSPHCLKPPSLFADLDRIAAEQTAAGDAIRQDGPTPGTKLWAADAVAEEVLIRSEE